MAKIALGCADPAHLSDGHFGESPGFVVLDSGTDGSEWRPNRWATEPIATRPPKIAALLADCDAIVMRAIATQGLAQLSQRFVVLRAPDDDVARTVALLRERGVDALRRYDPDRGKFITPASEEPAPAPGRPPAAS